MTKVLPNVLFIGMGIMMFWQIQTAPAGRALQSGDPGPWILPSMLAALMIIIGAAEVVRHVRKGNASIGTSDAAPDDNAEAEEDTGVTQLAPPPMVVRIVFVVALLAYVTLFQTLGFTLATISFVFATVVVLAELTVRNILRAALTAMVTSLAIGWMLAGVVGVPLPGVLLVP
ncbi:tripartite tricarboxylate transporter TctB family protein [Paracoccus litorisediminis]|uniref:tripartite tricarboxylate transporter TctB family protein n=1 Tax=Paracoccus litorisediminis TaxID=2006130 RepID=UPI003735CC99